jgi:hypothetical protein
MLCLRHDLLNFKCFFFFRAKACRRLHELVALPERLHFELYVRGQLEAVHLRGRLHRVHRQAEDLEEQRRLDRNRILRKHKNGNNNNNYYYSQFSDGCL